MRRLQSVLSALILLCSAIALPLTVQAKADYPNKPIKWIVAYPPGGTTDLLARLMGQQILIENRAGGGTNIGTEMAIKSPPDGYTIFLVNPANKAISPPFRPATDTQDVDYLTFAAQDVTAR